MKGTSSYQRSSKFLRENGWEVWKAENYYLGKSHDMANIYDAIGFAPHGDTYLLQFCGGSDYQAHVRKMTIEFPQNVLTPLNCKTRVLLIGWRKLTKKRGGIAKEWCPRISELILNENQQLELVKVSEDEFIESLRR